MLASSVVGQGEDGEDAAPELVAPYQSFSRELLGLHGFLELLGAALLRPASCSGPGSGLSSRNSAAFVYRAGF